MTENYDIKLINKRIISMILPVAFEGVLQMSAGLVMMGFIGRIDVIAVSALGISQRITQMVWALFKGITTGASVFVAQYYGAKETDKMKHVMQQTLISTILLVLLLQAGIYMFSSQLLSIFNPSPELLKSANTYIRTVSFGLPFLAVSLVIGGVLQGMGNAKTPMIITAIMNIINIVLGYILIFGNLGFEAMGIKGAAIATALSQIAACFIGLYVLFSRDGVLNSYLNKNFFRMDLTQIRSVYRVGLPTSMENMFWQLAAIILSRSILTYGETAFAAHQLGLQAESISYTPSAGFGIAATAFIGQALGAGDKKLAKIYLRQIMKGSIALTSISIIILVFFPKTMMALLTDNPEVINLGAIYLILMGLVQLPQNASHVLIGAMRGAGYTNIPMLVAGTGLWGIRVPLTLVAVYLLKLPIVAVWVVIAIDMTFRFLFNLVLYKKKNIYAKTLLK
jgi:putative MATE family efflux protein